MIEGNQLKEAVKVAYSKAAESPQDNHPFPVGRKFAASLGYPEDILNRVPYLSVESFAGVSNVSILAEIEQGDVVYDIGCGGGLDAFIALSRAGITGKVVGVDFSKEMIDKANISKEMIHADNIEFIVSDVEDLPSEDNSADVILANGIFNLNPYRERIFSEMYRVLKPGGTVFAAELITEQVKEQASVCTLVGWFS
ncbi:MAG: methyltransferase domain-containing protein [Nitrospirae bacterium]|nr:methyltransferase domain-containing protein [Nitrospirota bacterium]